MRNWINSLGHGSVGSRLGLTALFGTVLLFFSPWWIEGPRFWEDALAEQWPTQSALAGIYAQGRLPLWDPYTYGGDAWVGTPVRGIFYPGLVLLAQGMRIVGADSLSAMAFAGWIVIHYLLAATGGWLIGRQSRLGTWESLFAGLGYALSLTMVARFKHFTYFMGMAWLPVLVWLALRLAEIPSWRRAGFLGLALGSAWLATSPQHGFFLGTSVLLAFLFAWLPHRAHSDPWWPFVGAILVAGAMASAPLLYHFQYVAFCGRFDAPFEPIDALAAPWWVIARAFVPILTGFYHPGTDWTWIAWGESREAPYCRSFEESLFPTLTVWTGVFLYLWARGWNERRTWPWLALAAFGMLWSLFEFNPLRMAVRWILIPIATARCPTRAWFVAQLGLVILAIYGYRGFLAQPQPSPLARKALGTLLLCYLISVGIGIWRANLVPPVIGNLSATAKLGELVAMVILGQLLMVFALAGALLKRPPRHEASPAENRTPFLLILILCAELFGAGVGVLQDRIHPFQPDQFSSLSPQLQPVRQIVTQRHQRFDGWRILESSLWAALLQIPSLQGYSNLHLPGTGESFVGGLYEPRPGGIERRLDLYGVAFAWRLTSDGRYDVIHRPTAFPKAWFCRQSIQIPLEQTLVYIDDPRINLRETVLLTSPANLSPTPPPSPPSIQKAARVEIIRHADNEVILEVSSPMNGWVVINDHYAPGWNCTVDHKPAEILQADDLFRAVAVSEGSHVIRYWFWPQRLTYGLIVGSLGCLAGLFMILFGGQIQLKSSPTGSMLP